MLHNGSEESAEFATEIARQTGCAVVQLCPVGHGADPCPVTSFNAAISALVEDIQDQTTGPVYLIGFSLGGTLSVEAARRLGAKCIGVTTVSSFATVPMRIRIGCAIGLVVAKALGAKLPTIIARLAQCFGTPHWVCQEFASTRPSTVVSWLRVIPTISLRAEPLRCPSTHFGCQLDVLVPLRCQKQLGHATGGRHIKFKRATHATIPGATATEMVSNLVRYIHS
jgi:surfactin synthase thioesterase subunit